METAIALAGNHDTSVSGGGGPRRTEETKQMLAAVDVDEILAGLVAVALRDELVHFHVLVPLEAVQKDATEGFVEVLLDAGDAFFEDVGVGGAGATGHVLGGRVLLQELGGGDCGGNHRELLLFGDLLPVVDENGFQLIGDKESDGWTADEVFFLLARRYDEHVSSIRDRIYWKIVADVPCQYPQCRGPSWCLAHGRVVAEVRPSYDPHCLPYWSLPHRCRTDGAYWTKTDCRGASLWRVAWLDGGRRIPF